MCRLLFVGSGARAASGLTYGWPALACRHFGQRTRLCRGLCCAYLAQRGWTFGGSHAHARALPRYFVLQAGCAIFSGVVSHIAVARFGMAPLPMAVATTIAASAASYVVSSVWVFPLGDRES